MWKHRKSVERGYMPQLLASAGLTSTSAAGAAGTASATTAAGAAGSTAATTGAAGLGTAAGSTIAGAASSALPSGAGAAFGAGSLGQALGSGTTAATHPGFWNTLGNNMKDITTNQINNTLKSPQGGANSNLAGSSGGSNDTSADILRLLLTQLQPKTGPVSYGYKNKV